MRLLLFRKFKVIRIKQYQASLLLVKNCIVIHCKGLIFQASYKTPLNTRRKFLFSNLLPQLDRKSIYSIILYRYTNFFNDFDHVQDPPDGYKCNDSKPRC